MKKFLIGLSKPGLLLKKTDQLLIQLVHLHGELAHLVNMVMQVIGILTLQGFYNQLAHLPLQEAAKRNWRIFDVVHFEVNTVELRGFLAGQFRSHG